MRLFFQLAQRLRFLLHLIHIMQLVHLKVMGTGLLIQLVQLMRLLAHLMRTLART